MCVAQNLDALHSISEDSVRTEWMKARLDELSAIEVAWLARIILKDLKLGLGYETVRTVTCTSRDKLRHACARRPAHRVCAIPDLYLLCARPQVLRYYHPDALAAFKSCNDLKRVCNDRTFMVKGGAAADGRADRVEVSPAACRAGALARCTRRVSCSVPLRLTLAAPRCRAPCRHLFVVGVCVCS